MNKLEYVQRKKQQETAGRLILRDNRRNDGCLTQRADDKRGMKYVGDLGVTLKHLKDCRSKDTSSRMQSYISWVKVSGRPILVENKMELF